MSRKNKILRAFLHQNQHPTVEQAWNVAWKHAQKTFHAQSMQDMEKQIADLQAECDALRAKTNLSLGVGDGTGNLFVHGDYDSIKRVQALIFECEKLRKDVDILVEALGEFSYGLHQAVDGEDDCMCSQCRFIRLRGVALTKVTGEAQSAERQPVCPTCNGRGWNMDWQNEFLRAVCPDCQSKELEK